MSIITISRAFCSKGSKIAERVAENLNYQCISREILLAASDQFNIPEITLTKAIHDGPTIFDRFTHGKQTYIAYIRATLLDYVKKDNVVYHGLAGHFFLEGLPNVLKVRTIADMNVRIDEEMEKESISEILARKRLLNDDRNRYQWSMHLYGIDPYDPDLYDLVINLRGMSVNDCADVISNTVKLPSFASTPEAQEKLQDLALSARVHAMIIEKYFHTTVASHEGNVSIQINETVTNTVKIQNEIEALVKNIPGIRNVSFTMKSPTIRSAMHK